VALPAHTHTHKHTLSKACMTNISKMSGSSFHEEELQSSSGSVANGGERSDGETSSHCSVWIDVGTQKDWDFFKSKVSFLLYVYVAGSDIIIGRVMTCVTTLRLKSQRVSAKRGPRKKLLFFFFFSFFLALKNLRGGCFELVSLFLTEMVCTKSRGVKRMMSVPVHLKRESLIIALSQRSRTFPTGPLS